MGTSATTIFSMGTALDRAHDAGLDVEVLVGGQWINGQVAAIDGHGVVLAVGDEEYAVTRLDAVAAVRVHAPLPHRPRLPRQTAFI